MQVIACISMGHGVSIRFTVFPNKLKNLKCMNMGSITICGGTISVKITAPNRIFLPGNRNLAKLYAVSIHASSWSAETPADKSAVLNMLFQ